MTEADGSKQGEVIQRMNYYPFGAEFCDNGTKSYVQNHKYNGKEFDHMHGLNTYDYGARQYNPVTGRWDRMDPHCESYYNASPYVYCGNNPSNMVDYDGCDYWSTNDPEQIRAFINALGSGQNQFDFSGWSHATDAEFGANLTYNDETHKFYTSYAEVKNGELVVTGKSFDADLTPVSFSGLGYEGAFVYKPITNPLLKIAYAFDPLKYFDGFTNWTCNTQGRIIGVAPIMGMPPAVGFRGGKQFQKMGKAIGKMFGNRNVQKEQIESLASKHKLTKKERRILHDEISHQGYGYHEIEDLIYLKSATIIQYTIKGRFMSR